ncbi:MAG: hypothetical protein GY926_18270 [bacterium]|nr:hypothetical protein [bacterium]
MASEKRPVTSIEGLLSCSPQSTGRLIDELWNGETAITGSLATLTNTDMGDRFDLLQTMRILAMSTNRDPELAARLISSAGPSPELDLPALHTSAAAALCRPETMRWVSRNAVHVASTPNWRMVLPGLGGAIVSVPLAEEALMNLVGAKAELPKELTRYVQLNPWFSKRFAIRYRRYTGGKRFRIHDRAATARAWAHTRTLLGTHVPAQWRSPHGRGAGRPLDDWSYRLLVRYAALVESAYRKEGIPPTMAPLFAVASAAAAQELPSRDAVSAWQALPKNVEQAALNLIGLGSSAAPSVDVSSPKASSAIGAFRSYRGMNPRIGWQ